MAGKSTILLFCILPAVLTSPLGIPTSYRLYGGSVGPITATSNPNTIKTSADAYMLQPRSSELHGNFARAARAIAEERNIMMHERCRERRVASSSELSEEDQVIYDQEVFDSLMEKDENLATLNKRQIGGSYPELSCVRIDYTESYSITLVETCSDDDPEDGACFCNLYDEAVDAPPEADDSQLDVVHSIPLIPIIVTNAATNSTNDDGVNNNTNSSQSGEASDDVDPNKMAPETIGTGGSSSYKKITTSDGKIILQFDDSMPRSIVKAICQSEFASAGDKRVEACINNSE